MLHGAYTLLRDNKLLFSTEAYLRNLALLVPHVKEADIDGRATVQGGMQLAGKNSLDFHPDERKADCRDQVEAVG